MFNLIKAFLPTGWNLTATVGVVALVVGIGLGNRWQSAYTAEVQHRFDEYKIADLEDANSASTKTMNEMRDLQKLLGQIDKRLQEEKVQNKNTSDKLIKELQNANGKSCPLSPAIVKYLDGVRNSQGAGGN